MPGSGACVGDGGRAGEPDGAGCLDGAEPGGWATGDSEEAEGGGADGGGVGG